jgi:hypothetical protein
MDRRALYFVLLLVVGLFVYLGYNSYDSKRRGAGGFVYSKDQAAGKLKPGAVATAPAAEQTVAPAAPTPGTPETAQSGVQGWGSNGDTINPNPPNGMMFSGTGQYQLYRQGDITWRLDTKTGKTCIVFATDEEWKKPRVYRNGCGKR